MLLDCSFVLDHRICVFILTNDDLLLGCTVPRPRFILILSLGLDPPAYPLRHQMKPRPSFGGEEGKGMVGAGTER